MAGVLSGGCAGCGNGLSVQRSQHPGGYLLSAHDPIMSHSKKSDGEWLTILALQKQDAWRAPVQWDGCSTGNIFLRTRRVAGWTIKRRGQWYSLASWQANLRTQLQFMNYQALRAG